MQAAPGQRIDGLDIVRMLACFAVVVFHADIDVLGRTPILDRGLYGVHVFMVLSGYLLSRPFLEEGRGAFEWRKYFLRRIARIVPAYYVVVLIAAALVALGVGGDRHASVEGPLWWHVGSHLTFVHGWFAETKMSLLSALWSMSLEWQYYMVLPLLLWAVTRSRALLLFAGVVAASVAFRWSLYDGPFAGQVHLAHGFFLGRVPEFLFGVLLAAALGQKTRRPFHALLAVSAVALAASAAFWGPLTEDLGVASAAFLVVGLTRVYGPSIVTSRAARLLRYLGGASYSTYLVHLLAGKALLLVLDRMHLRDGLPVLAVFGAYIVAGHVAGVLFYVTVERPGSALLGRWLLRPRAAKAAEASA